WEPSVPNPVPASVYFKNRGSLVSQPEVASVAKVADEKTATKKRKPAKLTEREKAVQSLLEMETRPTIQQHIDVIQAKFGLKKPYIDTRRNFGEVAMREVPAIISTLERVFPNGTYYALGRDIYGLGDAMDAYYTYIGQPGRI